MDYGNKCAGDSMGHNAGMGNRAAASHVKGVHKAANHSTDWISSKTPPNKASIAHAPGASSSVLKTPRTTSRPLDT